MSLWERAAELGVPTATDGPNGIIMPATGFPDSGLDSEGEHRLGQAAFYALILEDEGERKSYERDALNAVEHLPSDEGVIVAALHGQWYAFLCLGSPDPIVRDKAGEFFQKRRELAEQRLADS